MKLSELIKYRRIDAAREHINIVKWSTYELPLDDNFDRVFRFVASGEQVLEHKNVIVHFDAHITFDETVVSSTSLNVKEI
jgi:hypothetical protein